MKRQIQLTLKEAQKIYKENPTMHTLLLTSFTKEELEAIEDALPTWKELEVIVGWYIANNSIILSEKASTNNVESKNIFSTRNQALSALAMAQLSQLMEALGEECDVCWDDCQAKYCIISSISSINNVEDIRVDCFNYTKHFLAFNTKQTAINFLNKHKQLIEQYFNY
jgi:hypothetical protein